MGGRALPNDFSFSIVFADDFVQKLRHEVIAIRQLARHAALHMEIRGLTLQSNLDDDFSFGIDFQDARFRPGFRQQNVARGELLRRIHL